MDLIKNLKRAVVGVITVGSTMVIAACYGVYETTYRIAGRALDPNGKGIKNLEVCVQENEHIDTLCTSTDSEGYFQVTGFTNGYYDYGFTICAEDTDGSENGSLETNCQEIPPQTNEPVDIIFNMDDNSPIVK